MPQWGMLLLCAYIGLGVCRMSRRNAGRLALVITVGVISVVMFSYMTSGPPVPLPSVSGDGVVNAAATNDGQPSSEDTDGAQQETPVTMGLGAGGSTSTTATTAAGTGSGS